MYKVMSIVIMMLFLVGCDDDYSFREEVLTVESVKFKKDSWEGSKAFIDTEESTIVAPINSLTVVKSDEETVLKMITPLYLGEVSSSRNPKYTLYVSKNELKEMSKQYANIFQSTLQVIEE